MNAEELKKYLTKKDFYLSLIVCYNYYLNTVNLFTDVYINIVTMIKGNLKLYPKSPKSSSSTAAPHCSTDIYLQRQKRKKSNTDKFGKAFSDS